LRRLIAIPFALLVLSLSLNRAGATAIGGDHKPDPGAGESGGSPVAIVVEGPTGPIHTISHPGPGRLGRWICHYFAGGGSGVGSTADGVAPITPEAGQLVLLQCVDESGAIVFQRVFTFDPADPLPGLDDPAQAAAQALSALALPAPAISASPPLGSPQLVGVPTWLWVSDWATRHATASLDGVTATVTATPVRTTWSASPSGAQVTCDGAGTPYDPARASDDQTSSCTMLFETAGAEQLSATVTYAITWSASTGDGGQLDPLTRTTIQAVVVDQAQALIN
jgi:hypothetical protein